MARSLPTPVAEIYASVATQQGRSTAVDFTCNVALQ
jgi:hypothetical protein